MSKSFTPVCYFGYISTPLNMTRHKTKRDWLLYLSVGLLRGPWPFKVSKVSRPSAISLKVWLHETKVIVDLKMHSDLSTPPTCQSLHQGGARQHDQYSPLTKHFSPAWTSLTFYTPIDAHKQTDSAILHLFTTLPYILLLFYF